MTNTSRIGRTLGVTAGAVAGVAGMVGLLASVGTMVALRRPLPRTSGKLKLAGLHHPVEVLRDQWGVPHIYASTNEDLFMALGYVHAQDRLWQMEVNRRTGHGQLAEIFGPIALSSDRFVRVLGLGRVARREVDLLDNETRTILEAYVQGVNAFLTTRNLRLPLEFQLVRHRPRPWDLTDVLVWGKVVALELTNNWRSKLLNAHIVAEVGAERARELLPDYADGAPLTVPAGISYSRDIGAGALRAAQAAAPFIRSPDIGVGSNGWVVSGDRSETGHPLLANDPHLNLTLPSIWYEVHLEGGDYAVAGVTFPGVPGVVIGHNAHIAWGITNSMVDVQDVYVERFHPEDPTRYAWEGTWEQAELLHEAIKVKGQNDPVVQEVRITRHGPIITSIAAPAHTPLAPDASRPTPAEAPPAAMPPDTDHWNEELALRWTALEPGQIARSLLRLNRAASWDNFREALADWDAPAQNFFYADVDGHYGYALGGCLPIRAQGDGRLPVPGWTGAYEWTGYIPHAALPAAYDPPEGLVVNANNRIAGPDYAYDHALHGEWLNGYRASRIIELLEGTTRHNVDSFVRIQSDLRSLPGLELARLVADLPLSDPLALQARDLLVSWDGELDAESIGGTIYTVLRYHLEHQVYAELGNLRNAPSGQGLFIVLPTNKLFYRAFPLILERMASARSDKRPDSWPGADRTWNELVQECMQRTVNELRQRLGKNPNNWRYGRIHQLKLRHALGSIGPLAPIYNRGPWPTGGDMDTICMGYAPADTGPRPIYTAPSYRQICDPGNWDASRSILASGQSGHPGSPHYSDMAASWRVGEYHPMLWSRPLVEQHTTSRLALEPLHETAQVAGATIGAIASS